MTTLTIPSSCLVALAISHPLLAKSYEIASPNGNVKATVSFDETAVTLSLRATSGRAAILP